jgi:hypothetical protein
MDPVAETVLLAQSGSAGNRTRDLWDCSQEVLPLDSRGGRSKDAGEQPQLAQSVAR